MGKPRRAPSDWPQVVANWLAFDNGAPWLAIDECPLFTDAWITGEIDTGPYAFINTVAAITAGAVRPAVVLRYAIHKTWDRPDMTKTKADLYHGGSAQDEIAALASLAMGVRFRAGNPTRRIEPKGDPYGRPQEFWPNVTPHLGRPHAYNLPSAANGEHALGALSILESLPKVTKSEAITILRAARLYQDALWLAESEPALTWLLLVSSLETGASEWNQSHGDDTERLRHSNKRLYEYLLKLEDKSILPEVAKLLSENLGITRKFVDFVMHFLPEPPEKRPPKGFQIEWNSDQFNKCFKIIYGYRSKALHAGHPFPSPMSRSPWKDPSWEAPTEGVTGLAVSQDGGVWVKKDLPMSLHRFEYIARSVLLKWWRSCAQL
jgi:hypothetical protein